MTGRGGSNAADAEAFLVALDHPLKPVILALRAIILGADDRITESIKWKAPSFCTSEHFATFHLRARDAVQVVLHLGTKPRRDATLRTSIADAASLLQWRGPDRAVVTFHTLQEVKRHEEALTGIVRQWIEFL